MGKKSHKRTFTPCKLGKKELNNTCYPGLDYLQWYFVTKIVPTYCEKNCSSDREKLLKFEAEGREFAKILRSLEQFIQTVKGQKNFW